MELNNLPPFPKVLLITGAVLILAGLIAWALQGRLGWLGHLPGDIRIERDNFSFYFPITTMILLSLLLSGLVRVLRFFWPG